MLNETVPTNTWSASRAEREASEKALMAQDFALHYFLVPQTHSNPEGVRETVASILVNQGTTPTHVVEAALEWVKGQRGHYFLTWYTPGALVPTILKEFRDEDRSLATSAKLFLFPGEVDIETESVSGPDAELFAENLKRNFTYAVLSAHAFDVSTGDVYFHLSREVRFQRFLARLPAAQKFLFLDSTKFRNEGDRGYGIVDLLETSSSVTIYTVCSDNDAWITREFNALAQRLLQDTSADPSVNARDLKTLQLRIVGCGTKKSGFLERRGILRGQECAVAELPVSVPTNAAVERLRPPVGRRATNARM
jgi:hypothetical protein